MNKYHKWVLNQIKDLAKSKSKKSQDEKYHGTTHKLYGLTNPEMYQIVKDFKSEYPELPAKELISTILSLNKSNSYEEKTIASSLTTTYKGHLSQITPQLFNQMLDNLVGWAEIDGLCQSRFDANFLIGDWKNWEKMLKKWNKSPNISKRRASLVLLLKPLRESEDARLVKLALSNIKNLLKEEDILITKAISWILREMTKLHRSSVVKFLKENKEKMPQIAYRETIRKLKTGKK